MDFEENVPEITSPILPDIELQKKKEEAYEEAMEEWYKYKDYYG